MNTLGVIRISTRLVLPALILSCLGVGQAWSQAFFRPVAQSGRFISAPRSLQQQIREAERSLAQGELSDAVIRLGDLLQRDVRDAEDGDLAGQDFFVDLEDLGETQRLVSDSVMRKARRMIGQLSPAALETYELRYGPMARKMLEDASVQRDWEAVRTVRRKYFHTKAGYEASYLLAQRELLAGHALSASLLLEEVVAMPAAGQHLGDGALAMYVAASKIAGRQIDGDLDVKQQDLVDGYAAADGLSGGGNTDYAVPGGSPSRNENAGGELPLTSNRWAVETTATPRQDHALEAVSQELASGGKLPPPSWTPLRVGDQLLMRTTERLVGVDYRTGKRVWTWPWFTAELDDDSLTLDSVPGEEGPDDLISQRVWNDLPYGQITSDGERAFILDDLGQVEPARFGPAGLGSRPSDTATNTLVALELDTQGKILWRLGAGADLESDLSNAFFLGPPLPVDGKLYVMLELAGDILLSCLDPATGNEIWRQQLVAVESGGIDSDPIRRVAGATPTYHEGLLICPTGAGAIVAIDLCDRMFRWGLNYDRNSEMLHSVSTSHRGSEAAQLMQRWHSGSAIAAGNTLIVTPVESDRLMGLDLITGQRRFDDKPRVQQRYVAGVRDDKFFVVSDKRVQAFELKSGDMVWATSGDLLAAGQQITGKGAFGNGDYFLPTNSKQLIQIDLENGEVLQRRTTNYPLGNLVAVGGEIITQSMSRLTVAFGEESRESIINRTLQINPDDFESLVGISELLIQRGQRREALETLARARAIHPSDDLVHLLSIAAMLGELRQRLDVDGELVETLDQLIEEPTNRAEFLSLRVRASLKNNQNIEAAKYLMDLSDLVSEIPSLSSDSGQIVGDVARHCSLDSWITARVAEIADRSDQDQLGQTNQLIEDWVSPRIEGSNLALRRLQQHFGRLAGVGTVRQELMQRYLSAGQVLELEQLALGARMPTAAGFAELPTDRLLALANSYARRGVLADASEALVELEKREVADIQTEIDALREKIGKASAGSSWDPYVSLDWESVDARMQRSFSVPVRSVAITKSAVGSAFRYWRLISDSNNPLALRDPTGLIRPIPLDSVTGTGDGDKEAHISGSFMVVVMPNEIVGIDLHSVLAGDGEAVRWQFSPSGSDGPIAKRRSKSTPFEDYIYRYSLTSSSAPTLLHEFRVGPVLGDRVLLLHGGDLMALSVENAQTLWRTSRAPKNGSILVDGDRVAVVSSDNDDPLLDKSDVGPDFESQDRVVLFNLLDGRLLDQYDWEHGTVWAAAGNHVLCYQPIEGENRAYHIRLIDPFRKQIVLEQKAYGTNRGADGEDVPRSFGRVVANRYLALLDSAGQATVWDLMEGRVIGQPQLAAYEDLIDVNVMLMKDQLVLLPRRRTPPPRLPSQPKPTTLDGKNHTTVHAAHAISIADGSVNWSKEFENSWGCTIHQPADSPMLLFTRSWANYDSTINGRRQKMDVVALNMVDGTELYRQQDQPIPSGNNTLETRLTIQSGLSRVIAEIGTELLTFKFHREPPVDADPQ